MAYTAPPTKSPGDLLTSALWNTYVLGNADSGFMRMIADSTLSGPAPNIDFALIPQTFAHLFAVIQARGDTAATSTTLSLQFNADTGAHYDYSAGIGGAVSSAGTSGSIGSISAANVTATQAFSPYLLWIPHYAQANTYKTCQTLGFLISGATGSTAYSQQIIWKPTAQAAINEIKFIPGAGNFAANCRFTLYGMPA